MISTSAVIQRYLGPIPPAQLFLPNPFVIVYTFAGDSNQAFDGQYFGHSHLWQHYGDGDRIIPVCFQGFRIKKA